MEDKEALMLTEVRVGEEESPASENKPTTCTVVYSLDIGRCLLSWGFCSCEMMGSH